jgi:hypothetical protein
MIEFILGAILGAFAFWLYSLYRAYRFLQDIVAITQHKQQTKTRMIFVETIDRQNFAYCKKTNSFLCQFSDIKDLNQKLLSIDPKATWVCDAHTVEKLTKNEQPV